MRARKGDSVLYGAISALGKWLLVSPYPLMRSLGILWALQSGRTGRAPPRESPFAPSPGLPPQGHLALDGPPLGGVGSARPLARLRFHREIAPLGHRAFDCPFMITLCVALRTASQCGRGDRVPSRKSPFASSPSLPPQGHLALDGPPRGGAGSARPEGRHHANPNIARFG
jgi:hypothetical protein